MEGRALITMRTPQSVETFTVKNGDIFYIPQGYVHHIENIGDKSTAIHFALNNSNPETMQLSNALFSISGTVFNSTFNTIDGFFDGLKKNTGGNSIKTLPPLSKNFEDKASPYKFGIKESKKALMTKGGYLQVGTKKNLSILEGLGILGFGLNPKGVVEPHWHTNAGELIYIVKGSTTVTLLSPDGKVEVLKVKAGEGAFAPASYFHNIENTGTENVEVIAFFSHHDPDYIGIGEVVGSYSNELLASIFQTPVEYFDTFKKPEAPLVIVPI